MLATHFVPIRPHAAPRGPTWSCVAALSWVALASCAAPQPHAAESSRPESPVTALPQPKTCGFTSLGHTLRPGEDLQFLFTVKANSQWCFDGFTVSGLSNAGEAIATAPEHGELRLVHQPGAIVMGYRPKPGFVGSDRFRVGLPTGVETTYFAGNVTVTP